MEKLVEIKNVTKRSDGKVIFDDVSLDIEKGGIIGLVGEEGSGKTLLFKMICGFVATDAGCIYVSGQPVCEGRFPESTGIMLDETELDPSLSGFDTLKKIAAINNRVKYNEMDYMLRLADLNPKSCRSVGGYTEGMKRRLKMALALLENPALALLENPVAQMDEERIFGVWQMLGVKNKEFGVTMLLTARDAGEIAEYCTHLYRISECRIISVF